MEAWIVAAMSLSTPTYAMHHDTKTHRLGRRKHHRRSELPEMYILHDLQQNRATSVGCFPVPYGRRQNKLFVVPMGGRFKVAAIADRRRGSYQEQPMHTVISIFPSAEKEVMDWSHCS